MNTETRLLFRDLPVVARATVIGMYAGLAAGAVVAVVALLDLLSSWWLPLLLWLWNLA